MDAPLEASVLFKMNSWIAELQAGMTEGKATRQVDPDTRAHLTYLESAVHSNNGRPVTPKQISAYLRERMGVSYKTDELKELYTNGCAKYVRSDDKGRLALNDLGKKLLSPYDQRSRSSGTQRIKWKREGRFPSWAGDSVF